MSQTTHHGRAKTETIGVTAVAWILAAVLGFLGVTKLTMSQGQVAAFQAWGYPVWFMIAVGLAEVTAAILLAVPQTSFYGGLLAVGVLAGAAGTLLVAGQYTQLPLPLVTAAGAGLVALLRRPAWLSSLETDGPPTSPQGST
jgi:hypothetical protein